MTYAMPTVLGHTFTAQEWAELNVSRLRSRALERRERAAELSRGGFARLGTDHPALLAAELAYGMANARLDGSHVSQTLQANFSKRGNEVAAARCAVDAAQDLAEGKRWALLYCLLAQRAKRLSAANLLGRVAHLVAMLEARLSPRTVEVRQPTAPRAVALASHLSAQAPPSYRVAALSGMHSALHTLKGVKN